MTTTIAQVRTDLAACVTTAGVRCTPYIVDVVNAPCAMVARQPFDPRMVLAGGKSQYGFQIHVYAQRAAEKASQATLDLCAETLGTTSLTAAIQTSTNWTSTIDYAQVTNIGGEQIAEINGVQYITIQIDVEVVF